MHLFSNLSERCLLSLPNLARLGQQWVPDVLQVKLLQTAFNQLFAIELANDELSFMGQKWLDVEINDLGLRFWLQVRHRRFVIQRQPQVAALSLKTHWQALCLLLNGRMDPDTLFFNRQLSLSGDTELGLYLKNFLDGLELDQKLPRPLLYLSVQLADWVEPRWQFQAGGQDV